jgi:hypothetical protein
MTSSVLLMRCESLVDRVRAKEEWMQTRGPVVYPQDKLELNALENVIRHII